MKQVEAQQSKHIAYDDEDEWEVIAEYATNHQQTMVAHEIVDESYRHAEKFMHASGMVMQPDYVGKQEDLYLWCLIRQSKTCLRVQCMRETRTKQTLMESG